MKGGGPGQFDALGGGGATPLGGPLNVTLINSFTPTAGQVFKILTFASSTGDFATKTGLALGANLSFNPVFNPADYTLAVSAPSPGILQFNTSTYSANVTSGSATNTLSRTNGSSGTVTVQYATSDGTAQAGVRYTPTSGTLTFANGVTSQSFTIALLNPASVHGNQTVNLILSNVTGGATLGSPT